MFTIIFATNNANKVKEIRHQLGDEFQIISLKEAGIDIDIPEPHETLEENASEKTKTIVALTGQNCFSEDTGLEVDALNGQPGVKSARYAGEGKNGEDNINKLLKNLAIHDSRSARFRTVISLWWQQKEYLFEGICEGKIIEERRGVKGFGYDSIFVPNGSLKSFGEMDLEEKEIYSHRARAVEKLAYFLDKAIKEQYN